MNYDATFFVRNNLISRVRSALNDVGPVAREQGNI